MFCFNKSFSEYTGTSIFRILTESFVLVFGEHKNELVKKLTLKDLRRDEIKYTQKHVLYIFLW